MTGGGGGSSGDGGGERSKSPEGSQKRQLWASAKWAERHQNVFELLDTLMASPSSKWNWFGGTTAEFVAARKRGPIIGLVTPSDKASNKVGLYPHIKLKVHGVILRQCVRLCMSQN